MKNGFGWKYGPFEIIDKLGTSFLKNYFHNLNKIIPVLLNDVGNDKFSKMRP